ncbi:MAG: hypothetical protein HOV81_20705 [Kofleriaceae bacterium]|nr:hypothetical protein [Kofleriaceae bacterium]
MDPLESPAVIDAYTLRMTGALRAARLGDSWRGVHTCSCGARSTSWDYLVRTDKGQLITSSLAIHYLAHHRHEVPEAELAKVMHLVANDATPDAKELAFGRPPVAPIPFPPDRRGAD